jgi:hypothetical protein
MTINIFGHGELLSFLQFIDSGDGRKQGFLNHENTRWLRAFFLDALTAFGLVDALL